MGPGRGHLTLLPAGVSLDLSARRACRAEQQWLHRIVIAPFSRNLVLGGYSSLLRYGSLALDNMHESVILRHAIDTYGVYSLCLE